MCNCVKYANVKQIHIDWFLLKTCTVKYQKLLNILESLYLHFLFHSLITKKTTLYRVVF